jgi:cytoskeletal protein CcmA (bactofilin family)
MWKKEDAKPQGVAENSTAAAPLHSPTSPVSAMAAGTPPASASRGGASISQGIRIKGEVTGSEDLFIDGVVEGKLNLTNGSLTIGPNGHVKADVDAREVVVRGKIEGRVSGRDRVQLQSTAQVTGEVQTERLAIEEGASLRGKVEAGKPAAKPAEPKAAAAAASTTSKAPEGAARPLSSGSAN